ncbi:DNA-binding protein, partial [Staphylococcus felis]|nr:DNA-binding protein [Staphylococcus felis]
LKESILEGLQVYGDSFTFTKLKNRLLDSEDNTGPKLVGRISKLLDKDPFVYEGNNFSWKEIFNNQGKVNIFQLKGYVIDIQKVITEFILWDLYNYTERQGDKSFPIPVLLDEMQNLNHKDSSPTTRILKEGRKFGWSSWLATQSISSIKSNGDVSSLFNSAQQIHFSPPEDQINYVSKTLSSDNNKRKELEIELSLLGKGECIVNGYAVINGELRKVIETIEINSLENR